MKKVIFLCYLLTIPILTANANNQKLKVTVSLAPLKSMAEAIGGNLVAVSTFIPHDQNPHSFKPTPKDLVGMRNCELFLVVGVNFEKIVVNKLAGMYPKLSIVDLSLNVIDKKEVLHDPHIWLSITNLKIMAQNVCNAMCTSTPSNSKIYQQNLQNYLQKLTDLQIKIKKTLLSCKGNTFFVYHPAFGYFAKDYGLKQMAIEIDGKSPSPRQLIKIIKQAKKKAVKVIFVQPQFRDKPAKIIAKRIGGKVERIDPLAENPLQVIIKAVECISGKKVAQKK